MASRKITASIVAVTMFALIGPSTLSQQPPTAAEAQHHLLQLTVPNILGTVIPPAVQSAIGTLKQALITQTDAVITQLPADATAASVTGHLSATMPAAAVGKISDEQWRHMQEEDSEQPVAGLYGGELTLSVRQPKPSLLLVQESFNIACGNDTVLLAYGNASGAWRRTLLWQSKPYSNIGGAFGDTYEALLLHPERDHHRLLLVLHGTPWCTSTMSDFDMDVLELDSPAATTPLWHGQHGYRRGDLNPALVVRPTAKGFEVRTSLSGAGDDISREGVMRYSVTATGVHRVEPLAINGRDSVVEWLELPRKEAAEFADKSVNSLTWQMFQEFTYEGKDKNATVPYPSVVALHVCKDSGTRFQVKVTSQIFDSSAEGSRPSPAYYVQLRKLPDGFRIHAVTHDPKRSCTGRVVSAHADTAYLR